MKINFLIPTTGLTGGIKVIFWHANNLADSGHQINLIHPFILAKNCGLHDYLIGYLKYIKYFLIGFFGIRAINHFNLNNKVRIIRVFTLAEKNIPEADISVATANQTADWLAEYSLAKGEKFYFIQDYETWTRKTEKVEATWKLPLKKIVISNWLKKIGEEKFGEKIYGVVPDGIDTSIFYCQDKKINKNKKILMQYHPLEKKGFKDGLAAWQMAKIKNPEIELILFGAYKPPSKLPGKYKFYFKPSSRSLKEIYSDCDIFLWPSREEGFGLPPMEAMACGCAVISTDTGAIRDYSVPDETVLIVPANRPEIMAEKLLALIADENKIKKLSILAQEKIKEYNWQKSTKKLEQLFYKETKD